MMDANHLLAPGYHTPLQIQNADTLKTCGGTRRDSNGPHNTVNYPSIEEAMNVCIQTKRYSSPCVLPIPHQSAIVMPAAYVVFMVSFTFGHAANALDTTHFDSLQIETVWDRSLLSQNSLGDAFQASL